MTYNKGAKMASTGDTSIKFDISEEHSAEGNSYHSTQEDTKHALRELNNRLAVYINKVRELETENKRLEAECHEFEIKILKIESSRKNESNSVLDSLRAQLDEGNTARVRSETMAKKLEREVVDLCKNIQRHEIELGAVVEDRDQLQDRLERTRNDLNMAESRFVKAQGELAEAKRDMAILFKKEAIMVQRLEEETASRLEIEGLLKPELNAYNTLLQNEEQRLHISNASTESIGEQDVSTSTRIPRPKAAEIDHKFADMKSMKRRRLAHEK